MSPDEKHKINVWIPGSLWKQIGSLGYDSPTKATIAAFEALVRQEVTGSNQEVLGSNQEVLGSNQEEKLPELEKQIEEAQTKIKTLEENLRKAPDLSEFSRLQARSEELEKHNSTLKADIEKANQREDDLKAMHNNYMLQMQTLINQKAIEAPGEKKPWWKFW
jgi:predicted  nucleic acid-binding Zn-ribbon protein